MYFVLFYEGGPAGLVIVNSRTTPKWRDAEENWSQSTARINLLCPTVINDSDTTIKIVTIYVTCTLYYKIKMYKYDFLTMCCDLCISYKFMLIAGLAANVKKSEVHTPLASIYFWRFHTCSELTLKLLINVINGQINRAGQICKWLFKNCGLLRQNFWSALLRAYLDHRISTRILDELHFVNTTWVMWKKLHIFV